MSTLRATIAVIDDDQEMRASITMLLSAHGYDVETFSSAEGFLLYASTSQASCLLVDVHLDDISGVELAHQLAADGFEFPVIFMTGSDDAVFERQAAAAGGVAFLHKPFTERTLIEAIRRAVG
jgi:FixJ family two-component response regulator